MRIEGKVFVVTGGASGLGEAACRELVARGGKVAVLDRDDEKGARVAADLGEANAIFVSCNVMDVASIEAAVEAVCSRFGRIHGNLNAAGGGPPLTLIDGEGRPVDMQQFENVIRLNLLGTVAVMSRCVAKMQQNEPCDDGERGCVLNVASIAAFDGLNGILAYSAAKAGIVGMTLPCARDLATRGVRVNTIAPGFFETPLVSGLMGKDGKLSMEGLIFAGQQAFPNKRFGRPAEFAHLAAAVFENVMVNGETIRLDAGIRVPRF